MSTTFLYILEFFLLPPGSTLLLLFIALMISRRLPLISFFTSLSAILLLIVLSMPIVARQFLINLQEYPALQMAELTKDSSDAVIVILGGGRYSAAPEYGYRDEISPHTLTRLRYGAALAKKLELPIVLSGGRRNANATSEAVIMNQVMVNVFKMNPKYLEVNGINTHEQAIAVKEQLAETNYKNIYLVTHAWHMKRAVTEFSHQGFKVTPAPMGFSATSKAQFEFLPSAAALASTSKALHEYYVLFYLNLTQ